MKIKIQATEPPLQQKARGEIEARLRIALGIRAAKIDELEVSIRPSRSGDGVSCRLTTRSPGDVFSVEEVAPERADAMEWAIWRVNHRLDRRALRAEPP